ncbi:unnamed protein product [Cyprideis torosa]|uniref:CXC MSL2-type domain-containing protein n=1 Tax=Cyprideis torosa TaxID=163714 RepID=A0A7R8ZQT7_9CRUS|nr:unnamed protein product [Cyprideis torosa]CAG0902159.1 unnamed protein product [Cyprideis torosa]
MKELLRFIYTGNIENVDVVQEELFSAAAKYDLQRLKEICEIHLAADLDQENVNRVLVLADLHESMNLKESCFKFVKENPFVMDTQEWAETVGRRAGLLSELCRALAGTSSSSACRKRASSTDRQDLAKPCFGHNSAPKCPIWIKYCALFRYRRSSSTMAQSPSAVPIDPDSLLLKASLTALDDINAETWPIFVDLVKQLRRHLCCFLCLGLLKNPLSSPCCPHLICEGCLSSRKKPKMCCLESRNFSEHQPKPLLQSLVDTYKAMCRFVVKDPFLNQQKKQRGLSAEQAQLLSLLLQDAEVADPTCQPEKRKSASQSPPPKRKTLKKEPPPDPLSTTALDKKTFSGTASAASIGPSKVLKIVSVSSKKKLTTTTTIPDVLLSPPALAAPSAQPPGREGPQSPPTLLRPSEVCTNELVDQPPPPLARLMPTQAQNNNGQDRDMTVFLPKPSPPLVCSTPGVSQSPRMSKFTLVVSPPSSTSIDATGDGMTFIRASTTMHWNKLRKGCRCGNATQRPGSLTCCGQRCPCYVDAKFCTVDCKCRGCRNPYRSNGTKVRLQHIPGTPQCYEGRAQPETAASSYVYDSTSIANNIVLSTSAGPPSDFADVDIKLEHPSTVWHLLNKPRRPMTSSPSIILPSSLSPVNTPPPPLGSSPSLWIPDDADRRSPPLIIPETNEYDLLEDLPTPPPVVSIKHEAQLILEPTELHLHKKE